MYNTDRGRVLFENPRVCAESFRAEVVDIFETDATRQREEQRIRDQKKRNQERETRLTESEDLKRGGRGTI
jgi:hypothetical protein